MADRQPTNRELKIMLDNISQRSEEKHNEFLESLKSIKDIGNKTLEQAQRTNGRVNRHDWYFKVIWWTLGAAWTLILVGVPLLWKLLQWNQGIMITKAVDMAIYNRIEKIEYEK